MAIRAGWNYNFLQEFQALNHCSHYFRVLYFDTEFPRFLRNTPRFVSENIIYEDLKFNVDNLKVIQLDITLSDDNGNIGGTWEFNFSNFNEKIDLHNNSSIAFLKSNSLDLDEIREKGIPSVEFSINFVEILRSNQGLRWVSFHANYDLAYLFKLITRVSMPSSVADFIEHCGGAHHAGSDILLSSKVFIKIITSYGLIISKYKGYLYGLSHKFMRRFVVPKIAIKHVAQPAMNPYPIYVSTSMVVYYPPTTFINYYHI
ncbi:hypothetical protein UlMin_025701 [Ulmus minor]